MWSNLKIFQILQKEKNENERRHTGATMIIHLCLCLSDKYWSDIHWGSSFVWRHHFVMMFDKNNYIWWIQLSVWIFIMITYIYWYHNADDQALIKCGFGSQRKVTKCFGSQPVVQKFSPKRAKMGALIIWLPGALVSWLLPPGGLGWLLGTMVGSHGP